MQNSCVRARCDYRGITMPRASVLAKYIAQHRFNLVFICGRSERAHRGQVAFARDSDCAAQQLKIVFRFNEAHLVEDAGRVNDGGRTYPVSLPVALAAPQKSDHSFIERGIAKAIIYCVGLSDEARQFLVELIYGKCPVRSVIANG